MQLFIQQTAFSRKSPFMRHSPFFEYAKGDRAALCATRSPSEDFPPVRYQRHLYDEHKLSSAFPLQQHSFGAI